MMDKTTGLEYLPREVLEYIASYLSVEDIIACCATSSLMRHAFNGDFVWKRRCDLEFVDYLNKSESLTEPSFEWSEVTDNELSTLSPLSTWRKNYILKNRLYQNWREGRYNKESFEFGDGGIYISTTVRFYKNDFIFFHTNKIAERRLQNEIWSVKDTHFLHSTFILNFNEFLGEGVQHNDKYEIVGNMLVVSQGNLVLIYDISLSNFSSIKLSYAFLFELSEEESNHIISRARAETGFYLSLKFTSTLVCGNFVIGIVARNDHIHIWNIQSGNKIANQINPLPLNNTFIEDWGLVTSDEEAKHFIIKVILPRDRHRYHYYGYNLTKIEYSSFTLKHNYCDIMILSGRFVIGVNSQKLFSYNYETSEKLAVRKCNYHILKKSVILVGSHLLCGTADSTVFVMDPFNLNIINSVKLDFTLYSLKSICNKFVMINSINIEVWEIGKTVKQLFKFPCDTSFAAVNQHCTKVALEKKNKIIILTFW